MGKKRQRSTGPNEFEFSQGEETENKSFSWTNFSTLSFLRSLLKYYGTDGSDNGLKSQTWTKVLNDFNQEGWNATKPQLQSKLGVLKKEYSIVKSLREQSGFGWDALTNLPDAPDDVKDRYITAHPETKKFWNHPFEYFDDCCQLFDGK